MPDPSSSERSTAPAQTLAGLIDPVPLREFIDSFWGKRSHVFDGSPDRFEGLLPADELDRILNFAATPNEAKLVENGKQCAQSRFLSRPRTRPQGLINAAAMGASLAEGATLVVDGIERFSPALRCLVEDAERELATDACINLYVGWKSRPGLGLHWDDQETFLIQVEGEKGWSVYQPTRLHPVKAEWTKTPEPTDAPFWQGTLKAGQVLYLPRGWWHAPRPVPGRSVHLTLTLVPCDGLGVMEWLTRRLMREPGFRRNVPLLGSTEVQDAYRRELSQHLQNLLGEDFFTELRRDLDAHAEVRSQITLPRTQVSANKLGECSEIRLAAAKRLGFMSSEIEGVTTVYVADQRWQCGDALVPALSQVNSTHWVSVARLSEDLESRELRRPLLVFLGMLALSGAIEVRDRPE